MVGIRQELIQAVFDELSRMCSEKVIRWQERQQIGGVGVESECDEVMLRKVAYRRGANITDCTGNNSYFGKYNHICTDKAHKIICVCLVHGLVCAQITIIWIQAEHCCPVYPLCEARITIIPPRGCAKHWHPHDEHHLRTTFFVHNNHAGMKIIVTSGAPSSSHVQITIISVTAPVCVGGVRGGGAIIPRNNR